MATEEVATMFKFFWILGIIFVFLFEVIVMHEINKNNSELRNTLNKIEFQMDREKYVAYPLRRNTLAWRRIEDIPKEQKATSVDLEEKNAEYIIAQDICKDGKLYYKLYKIQKNNIWIGYVDGKCVCRTGPYNGK